MDRKDNYLGFGGRLKSTPSDLLASEAFQHELEGSQYIFEYLTHADLAHCAMLRDANIISEDEFKKLCQEIIKFHKDNGEKLPEMSPYLGDIYNNRSVLLKEVLGDLYGKVHTARARREAVTLAWQLRLRELTAKAMDGLISLVHSLSEKSNEHRKDPMPDYTYLHRAQPTTIGHYLLCHTYPLSRSVARLKDSFELINSCPAGSGSVNGSMIYLDRNISKELLEFDHLLTHTRDAMWAPDMAIDMANVITLIFTSINRLSEELLLWTTSEYNYLDLDDAHCRTSVIMPHKKNPYGLSYLRGAARQALGELNSIINSNLSVTGQPDNRTIAYIKLPKLLESVAGATHLLADIISKGTFNLEQMKENAIDGFTVSTDICDYLITEFNMDNRSAHKLVGLAIRKQIESGHEDKTKIEVIYLEEAAKELKISIGDISSISRVYDLAQLIEMRNTIGGCSEKSIQDMIKDISKKVNAILDQWDSEKYLVFKNRFIDNFEEKNFS